MDTFVNDNLVKVLRARYSAIAIATISILLFSISLVVREPAYLFAFAIFQTALLLISISNKFICVALSALGLSAILFKLFFINLYFWPFILYIPLFSSLLLMLNFTNSICCTLPLGELKNHLALIFLISLGSISVLTVWVEVFKPDLYLQREVIPESYPWMIFPMVLGFAIFNAALEELVYRGLLQGGLLSLSLNPFLANCIQALAFAIAHFEAGFPSGTSGLVLTLSYGLLLGWMRNYSAGLLTPYFTHIITDIFIGCVLMLNIFVNV
ncbi:CPBP family intramembrane glutamic endopeptidase [Microbulbifer sp. TRSA007]|uniref:CPBP family intramembrane glutamic endopeptidase n=1 Tax=Microbulbifer sp. TRSA007 TaxID=3243384 RepID=UPI004039E178